MYVKLVNGELIEAPEKLELEDGIVLMEFNRSIDLMTQHGFKPLVDTKPNHNVDKQYCNFVEYYDTGRYIRCRWEIEDIELSEAELQNREAQAAMQMLNIDFQEQVQTLTDEQALEVKTVFPMWSVGVKYEVGFKVRFNDILYKVLQAHTSQVDWTPDVAVSLFVQVGAVNDDVPPENETPPEEIIPEWVQPGSTNPYMKGDKVVFEGKIYESLIDNNVWSPAAYPAGWAVVE